MYKRVDVEEQKERIEGFSYINQDGDEEFVTVSGGALTIKDGVRQKVIIYRADLPNLIKALQAAEEHYQSQGK